jgi:DNA repair ATPase RecN
MDNEDEVEDVTLDVQEEVEDTQEVEETEGEEEDVEDIKARLAKAEELANNYKVRAEKAEGKTKEIKTPKSDSKLSNFDMLALAKANIETKEDLDEVTSWAEYKKVSVAEALQSSVLKTILAEKTELRNSAAAVNMGTSRRANSAGISDDRLYNDAQKGILPESSEDIARLARLRLKRR